MQMKLALCAIAMFAAAACAKPASESEAPSGDAVTQSDSAAAPDATGEQPAADLCHAADYQSLVGSNIAAVTLPADLNHRVIRPGDTVTEEFNAERLSIYTDEAGVITEAKCG
jgi:hypothetical protein